MAYPKALSLRFSRATITVNGKPECLTQAYDENGKFCGWIWAERIAPAILEAFSKIFPQAIGFFSVPSTYTVVYAPLPQDENSSEVRYSITTAFDGIDAYLWNIQYDKTTRDFIGTLIRTGRYTGTGNASCPEGSVPITFTIEANFGLMDAYGPIGICVPPEDFIAPNFDGYVVGKTPSLPYDTEIVVGRFFLFRIPVWRLGPQAWCADCAGGYAFYTGLPRKLFYVIEKKMEKEFDRRFNFSICDIESKASDCAHCNYLKTPYVDIPLGVSDSLPFNYPWLVKFYSISPLSLEGEAQFLSTDIKVNPFE